MITVEVQGRVFTPKTGFDAAAEQILHLFEVAEHQSLRVAGEIAYVSSSGTATEQMLSTPVADGGYGHPYGHGDEGRAGPRGPIPNDGDAGVINVQTGEFLLGWREIPGYFGIDTMTQELVNTTEHAKFLEETPDKLQIRRPVVERIEHILEPIRQMNLEHALEAVNRL